MANEGGIRGPLPIVVGICGHRYFHVDDADALSGMVREKFAELRDSYPYSPLLVMSPLAVGADRLAAQAALSVPGVELVVPMPFEQEEYEKDFRAADPTGALRKQFRELLDKARCAYPVGYLPAGNESTLRYTPAPGVDLTAAAARDQQYAQVGAYIGRNSQLLIALWDGRETDRVGGTAQIVSFKKSGYAPHFGAKPDPLDVPESSPVYHIPTRRPDDPEQSEDRRRPTTQWPDAPASSPRAKHEKVHAKMLEQIERFNIDALQAGAPVERPSTEAIRTTALTLADRYRDRTLTTLTVLYVSGFVAAVFFIVYAHYHAELWVLALDLLATLVAVAIYRTAEIGEFQTRYQDYRAVVEGLRVQSFWHEANLHETVADHYLRQHRTELDWIRNAIRVCRVLDDTARVTDVPQEQRRGIIADVRTKWIDGQLKYLGAHRNRERDMLERLKRIALATLVASVFLVIFVLVGYAGVVPVISSHLGEPEHLPWKLLIVVISLTAVVSGLIESFADKRAFRVHTKQFRRLRAHFGRARALLNGLLDEHKVFDEKAYADAQGIIRDLGIEVLAENGAWVMLHRDRPVEFVHGG